VAVIGPSGKRLQTQVLETNAKVLIDFIRAIPGNRHLCLEEGTHSNWLYEVLSPHVQEIVVAGVRQDRGPKSDKIDAFGLAEKLPARSQSLAETLYLEYDALEELRERTEKAMLDEARKHAIWRSEEVYDPKKLSHTT
jgi:hypothetical protein